MKPKLYLAGCNPNVINIPDGAEEGAIEICKKAGFDVVRPLKISKDDSQETKLSKFQDNISKIEDADVVLAIVLDYGQNVAWELGTAYSAHKPVLTYIHSIYESAPSLEQLMDSRFGTILFMSSVGITKSAEDLKEALEMLVSAYTETDSEKGWAIAIGKIQTRYKYGYKDELEAVEV